jgi:hypothetical protein
LDEDVGCEEDIDATVGGVVLLGSGHGVECQTSFEKGCEFGGRCSSFGFVAPVERVVMEGYAVFGGDG